jgi:hypothetical protein
MANETRGLLFETIADAALQKAIGIAGISGQVFWNEKPKGVSIVPDFTIGKDKDNLSHVILVTASGSSSNSHMKSSRNLGELFEAKAQLPTVPLVLNLYFMSQIKQNLSEITQLLYDATIHTEGKSYYESILGWVQENVDNDAKTREARQAILEQDAKADPKLAKAIYDLATDLSEALQQNNKELNSLWKIMREDYLKPHNPPEAKQTYIRRGLGKLFVVPSEFRDPMYRQVRDGKKTLTQMPAYLNSMFKFLGDCPITETRSWF